MKKKKEKQLKEIEKIRKELRYMLEEYLDKKSRRGRKKYTAFIELLQLLKAINLDVMEMEEVNFGSIEICPHIKLDTVQNISICLTIIYTTHDGDCYNYYRFTDRRPGRCRHRVLFCK